MKIWVFDVALALATTVSLLHAQGDCSSGRPFRLIPTITPVVGQSPLWMTTGSGPIAWEGPKDPVQVLVVRDVAVKGPAFLSGKQRTGAAKARFAFASLGLHDERIKLDDLGFKPATVKEGDLQKYAFHRMFIWFPEPSCYEITARVGRQQSLIYLNVAPKAGKGR
jgi:hypothetical protein